MSRRRISRLKHHAMSAARKWFKTHGKKAKRKFKSLKSEYRNSQLARLWRHGFINH